MTKTDNLRSTGFASRKSHDDMTAREKLAASNAAIAAKAAETLAANTVRFDAANVRLSEINAQFEAARVEAAAGWKNKPVQLGRDNVKLARRVVSRWKLLQVSLIFKGDEQTLTFELLPYMYRLEADLFQLNDLLRRLEKAEEYLANGPLSRAWPTREVVVAYIDAYNDGRQDPEDGRLDGRFGPFGPPPWMHPMMYRG